MNDDIKDLARLCLGMAPKWDITSTDFEKLIDVASRHRIMGILAEALHNLEGIDEKHRLWSTNIINEYKQRLDIFEAEMHSISQLLKAHGIKHYFLKGVDYANRLYKNRHERFMRDLDMMVDASQVWKVTDLLKTSGYKQARLFLHRKSRQKLDLYEDEIPTSYIREENEVYLHRCHDPVSVVRFIDSGIVDSISIDLHQNKNFHVLDINKMCEEAMSFSYKSISSNYLAFSDMDTVIFAAWHLFHHLVEQVPDEGFLFIRYNHLKQVSDLWRSLDSLGIENPSTQKHLIGRIIATKSMNIMLYALEKLIALFNFLDEPPPSGIIATYEQLLSRLPEGLSRSMESTWNYAGECFNFWQWILDTHSEMESISLLISINRKKGLYNFHAKERGKEQLSYIPVREPAYVLGADRLASLVQRDDNIDLYYPSFDFATQWNEDGIYLHFITTDNIEMQIKFSSSVSDEYNAFKSLTVRMYNKTIKLHSKDYDLDTLNNTIQLASIKENEYTVFIPGHILPFELRSGNSFAMRLIFETIDKDEFFPFTPENYHPKLSWPAGIVKCANILLV